MKTLNNSKDVYYPTDAALTAEFIEMLSEKIAETNVMVHGPAGMEKQLKKCAQCIEKSDSRWELKVENMMLIRSLLTSHSEWFARVWPKCHRIVCPALISALKSQRSAVQKEACATIAFLSANLTGGHFTVGAELVIGPVLASVGSKNTISSRFAALAAEYVVRNVRTPAIFNAVVRSVDHKSSSIRICAQLLMGLVLEEWSSAFLKGRQEVTSNFVRHGIRDASCEVRNIARDNFWIFARRYPLEATQNLFASLECNYKRMISDSCASDLCVFLPLHFKDHPEGDEAEVSDAAVQCSTEDLIEEIVSPPTEAPSASPSADEPVPEGAGGSGDPGPRAAGELEQTPDGPGITPDELLELFARGYIVPHTITVNSEYHFVVKAGDKENAKPAREKSPFAKMASNGDSQITETKPNNDPSGEFAKNPKNTNGSDDQLAPSTPRDSKDGLCQRGTFRMRSGTDGPKKLAWKSNGLFLSNVFEWRLRPFMTTYARSKKSMGDSLVTAKEALDSDSWRLNCQGLVLLRKCLETNTKLEKKDLDSITRSLSRIFQSKAIITGGTQLIHLFDMVESLAFLYLEEIEDWLKSLPKPLLRLLNKGVNRWVQVRFFQLFNLISETFQPITSFTLFLEPLKYLPPRSPGALAAMKVLLKVSEELAFAEVREFEQFHLLEKYAAFPDPSPMAFYSRLILANLGYQDLASSITDPPSAESSDDV